MPDIPSGRRTRNSQVRAIRRCSRNTKVQSSIDRPEIPRVPSPERRPLLVLATVGRPSCDGLVVACGEVDDGAAFDVVDGERGTVLDEFGCTGEDLG